MAVLAALVGWVAATQGRSPASLRSSQFEPETRTVDLGVLEPNAAPRHTFTLTNSTDSVVEILGVHTSCGCEAAAVRVGERIGPGQSLPIPYSLSNRGSGRLRGTLTIETSSAETDLKQVFFTLSATVPRKIWTEPEMIEFRTSSGSETPEPVPLLVFAVDPTCFANSCRVSTSRQLASAQPTVPEPPGEGNESGSQQVNLSFLVRLRENPPAGMTMDYLTLEFEGRPEATLHVPVIASVETAASVPNASPDQTAPTAAAAPSAELQKKIE